MPDSSQTFAKNYSGAVSEASTPRVSAFLPDWLKDAIEVDYDRDYGNGERRGIFVHELFLANWVSLWFVDLMFKGSKGSHWRGNMPGIAILVAGAVLQIPRIRGQRNGHLSSSGRADDGTYKISQYADTLTGLSMVLSAAWFAYRIPFGNMPIFFSRTRAETSGVLTGSQWVYTKTLGKAVNSIL